MRNITDHHINRFNEEIKVIAADEPAYGGANHEYQITVNLGPDKQIKKEIKIELQKGPIAENGINGISHESLLAIVIDRLRGFQGMAPVHTDPMPGVPAQRRGPFGCRENALALTNLEQALLWLQKRSKDRLARGVEGRRQA